MLRHGWVWWTGIMMLPVIYVGMGTLQAGRRELGATLIVIGAAVALACLSVMLWREFFKPD